MIRKAVIVVLTLGAVGTVAVGVRSYSKVIRKEVRIGDLDRLYSHFNDGFVRVFWIKADEEISLIAEPWPPTWPSSEVVIGPPAPLLVRKMPDEHLHVLHSGENCQCQRLTLSSAESLRSYGLPLHGAVWLRRWPTLSPGCPLIYYSLLRTRAWVVAVVLAAYPTVAFICGPLRRSRRRRKGSCVKCGYDLTGNVTGVCPECGTEIVSR